MSARWWTTTASGYGGDRVIPGGTQRLHRHDRRTSIVIYGSDGEILGADGDVRYALRRGPGEVRYFGPGEVPLTHALRNTGERDIRIVVVELLT